MNALHRQLEELASLRKQGDTQNGRDTQPADDQSGEDRDESVQSRKMWRVQEPRRLSEMLDVGSETPEAAMQSMLWASRHDRWQNVADLVRLPQNIVDEIVASKGEGKPSEAEKELAHTIYSKARQLAMLGGQRDGQVWLEGGGRTDYTSMRQPNGQTYEYSNVVHFQLCGSTDPSNPRATHHTDFYFTQTPEGWKYVLPGVSPEIKAQ